MTIHVSGMHCEGCEHRLEKAFQDFPNVREVKADHKTGEVTFVEDGTLDMNAIQKKLEELDFTVVPENEER